MPILKTGRLNSGHNLLKIAMLTKNFNFRNGSSVVINETSIRLTARGHEVHIFCNRRPVSYDRGPILRHIPILSLGSWARVASFNAICARRLREEQFDIIHGHGNTVNQDIVTVHTYRRANLLARGLSLSRWDPHLWIESKKFRNKRLKRIITLSEKMSRVLQQDYGIPAERFLTISSGVDADRFKPEHREVHRSRIRQEIGLSGNDLMILFVASGNYENRGLASLLAALKGIDLPRLKLIVTGGDQPGPYRAMSRGLGLGSQVMFLPFSDRLEELHAGADALIFPSYYDIFGNVPLEAMASGLPVIVTVQCGVSELITDGVDGLILKDPQDIEGIRLTLKRLVDQEFRKRLGQKARETALRQSWDKVADQTLKCYEELRSMR